MQARTGGGEYTTVSTPHPGQEGGGGTPRYLPPPQDRTAYGVLDTLRSVCLLRSRRTFLFLLCFQTGSAQVDFSVDEWIPEVTRLLDNFLQMLKKNPESFHCY